MSIEELRQFCEDKGWLIEEFIDADFVWAEGFIVVNGDKHISVELNEDKILLNTPSQKYVYKCSTQAKHALIWLMR